MSFASLTVTNSSLNDLIVLTVRYAQIITHLKMSTYPTNSDYNSLAIQFNIMRLSNFYLFSFGFVCRGKGHLQTTDSDKITVASRLSCIVQVTLTKVLKKFSIT